MARRLSVRSVTIVGLMAVLVAVAILAAMLLLGTQHSDAMNHRVSVEMNEITAYHDAESGIAREGAYLASYYALHAADYIQAYRQEKARVDAALQSAQAIADSTGHQESADTLIAEHNHVNAVEEQGIQYVQRGDTAGAASLITSADIVGITTKLTDDVHGAVANARQELNDAQAAEAAAQANVVHAEIALIVTLSVLAFAGALGAFRWLVRPLEQVSRASRAIAVGDLAARVPETGPRELATVGADVNRMADALIRRSDELNAYLSKNLESRTLELEESEERFRSLVQNASDLITVISADTTVVYQSPSITLVLGRAVDEVVGARLVEFIHEDDVSAFVAFTRDLIVGSGKGASVELRLRHIDASWRHLEIVGSDRREDRAVRGLVLNMRDVTERKHLEEELRRQAFHDSLTGLANRARFLDRLEHAVLRGARANARLAVLFIDLDNFKSVNDTLGHTAGDALLARVASVLQACVREGDTVARLGGDEFAVLLEDIVDDAIATDIAARVVDRLRPPALVEHAEALTRASVGVVLAQCRGARPEELLRDADIAMYAAKDHGKGRYEVYDAGMHASMLERLQLLADLEGAVERNEFIIDYQPTVDLRSGAIVGAEALVRWQHPVRGLIAPLDFIPLSEESGAILGIGHWVLLQACTNAARWQALSSDGPTFMISINVSVRQLAQASFVSEVADVIAETGVDPAGVVLEITESVMMQDASAAASVLRNLKELGVKVAIDDFGTGYSSLGYLRQFPFDMLKIDKSFVEHATVRRDDKELERLIIEIGKTLNLSIVAEGIERADQLVQLLDLTCEFGQGFYFARPLPETEIDAMLRSSRRMPRAA